MAAPLRRGGHSFSRRNRFHRLGSPRLRKATSRALAPKADKRAVKSSGGRSGRSVAPQPDAAAGSGVFDREVEPMQLCDGGDETKAEAAARRMPALLDPMEAPQHRITLGFGNAGTRVAHFDAEPVARLECAQGD